MCKIDSRSPEKHSKTESSAPPIWLIVALVLAVFCALFFFTISFAFAQEANASCRIPGAHQFNQEHIFLHNVAPVETKSQSISRVACGAPEVKDEWGVMRLALAKREIIFNRPQNDRDHFYRRVSTAIFQTGDFNFGNNQYTRDNQIVLSAREQCALNYRATSRGTMAFLQFGHLFRNIIVRQEWKNSCGQGDPYSGRISGIFTKNIQSKYGIPLSPTEADTDCYVCDRNPRPMRRIEIVASEINRVLGGPQRAENKIALSSADDDQAASKDNQPKIEPPARIIWWRRGVVCFVLLCGGLYAVRNGLFNLLRGQYARGWGWLCGAFLFAEGAAFTLWLGFGL